MHTLYKMLNHDNGKVYIGISENPINRLKTLKFGNHSSRKLQSDFNKGDNIELFYLLSGIKKEDSLKIEAEEIDRYDAELLYNKQRPLTKKLHMTLEIKRPLHDTFKKAVLENQESMTEVIVRFMKSYIDKTTAK